ncbi:phosphotransferase family protein [Umezawaea endophytica]|uniref:Aminoglycoside phosphotransferase family protein n=1 Tax=Umezawaea endophytica TaxID=1654476 RepID=A0A9X2VT09_9PSEU|nr:aminoglycoside phosphotransferase family protein [Umezawaea endophytica]MCS7482361.1 aminoglycoside phosphotransferase family protein [Umezawaea endophytica]
MAALVPGGVAPVVLAVRGAVVVVRVGDVVLKAHEPGAGVVELSARLRLAGDLRLRELVLPPLSVSPSVVEGRVVTVWPLGVPVPERDPVSAPLEEAGRLLAALHRFGPADFGGVGPVSGAPQRMVRAVDELRRAGLGRRADVVLRAFGTLPLVEAPARVVVCHGDWHLGQMVLAGGWRLIDVDDLGFGDPAWDLARPAALYAAGVLDPETWGRFLDSYVAAGGVAVDARDPWVALDVPARALVIQMAARALVAAQRDEKVLDEAQEALLEACDRIVAAHPHMARG